MFISIDGDGIGRKIGRARMSNDVPEVRRLSHAIEAGNQIWVAFAVRTGGEVIEEGGDEVSLQVGADSIAEIPDLVKQYQKTVGANITVGVGKTLKESADALLWGKLTGKNKVAVWKEAEMKPVIDKAAANPPTDEQKTVDEYLGKGADDGSGRSPPQRDHGDPAPAAPAAAPQDSSGAQDFHALAGRQEKADRAQQAQQSVDLEALKQQVGTALQAVKSQLPVIEQVATSYPETAKAVLGLANAVTALARGISDAEETFEKAEVVAIGPVGKLRQAVRTRLTGQPPVRQQEPDPAAPPTADKTLDKTAANPTFKPHRELNLPVGATHAGEVKVMHSSGKAGWRSVRGGMISGTDDVQGQRGQHSHPVSSREPNSS